MNSVRPSVGMADSARPVASESAFFARFVEPCNSTTFRRMLETARMLGANDATEHR